MLNYLADHPALWLIILPFLGAAVNAIGRPLGARYPELQPVVRALLDALPNLPGAVLTLVHKRPLDPPVLPTVEALLRQAETKRDEVQS